MSPYAITCIIVFTAAAVLHSKAARPLWLYGLTGLAFLAAGVTMDLIPALLSQDAHTIRLMSTGQNGTLQETRYTVHHLNFARPVGTLLLAVTAFLALQQILGAMYLPRLTR